MTDTGARDDLPLKLRPARPGAVRCKICGSDAELFGVLDFNRSCGDQNGPVLPLSGVPIYYRRCATCDLCFTDAFDDWSQADFEAHIYNADYERVDPDYVSARPAHSAASVINAFAASAPALNVLDYGGGNGRFAEAMREAGFACTTYDPFNPAFAQRPERRFELVTCFETLEHMPDPVSGIAELVALTADNGLLLFSTMVQPADFERIGVGWWYIGPRNGHITLFSRVALVWQFKQFGLTVASFDDNLHMAYRGAPPAFAEHLLPVIV